MQGYDGNHLFNLCDLHSDPKNQGKGRFCETNLSLDFKNTFNVQHTLIEIWLSLTSALAYRLAAVIYRCKRLTTPMSDSGCGQRWNGLETFSKALLFSLLSKLPFHYQTTVPTVYRTEPWGFCHIRLPAYPICTEKRMWCHRCRATALMSHLGARQQEMNQPLIPVFYLAMKVTTQSVLTTHASHRLSPSLRAVCFTCHSKGSSQSWCQLFGVVVSKLHAPHSDYLTHEADLLPL